MDNWIKTSKTKPDKSGPVLCYFELFEIKCISVEWYSMSQDDFLPIEENGNVLNTPKYWMTLPDMPRD